MRTPEQVQWDFVKGWLRKANDDLRAAKFLLKQQFSDYEVAAFHGQQCVEKAIKAYLVRYQIEFPKTHEIQRLRKIVATQDAELADELTEADLLSPYAVEFRYPGELEVVSHELAKEAVSVADRVNDIIRRKLAEYLESGRPD